MTAPDAARAYGIAELTVVRHGQSAANLAMGAANEAGRLDNGLPPGIRDTDVPLTPLGERQAAALGRHLAAMPEHRRPEVIVCSPYQRARDTLRIMRLAAAPATIPGESVDARLRDREMGVLELLTDAAVAAEFPQEAVRRINLGDADYRPPGGESLGDVARRLAPMLSELDAAHPGARVLLVAHDATVLMLHLVLRDRAGNHPSDGLAMTEPVANASITRWITDGAALRLRTVNEVGHLSTAGLDGEIH